MLFSNTATIRWTANMRSKCPRLEDLPPCPPEREFFYCPDPMLLTDNELDALIPRERRIAFLHELATQTNTTPNAEPVQKGAYFGRKRGAYSAVCGCLRVSRRVRTGASTRR